MVKPYLLIVTGRPGAGKTTFADALGDALNMPVLSRDRLKEGYVHTHGMGHAALPPSANGTVTGIFFDTLKRLIGGGVSLIAEAAFQHRIWLNHLEPLMDATRMFLLICKVDDETAHHRFMERGRGDASRAYFHGDVITVQGGHDGGTVITPYEEPRIAVPTYHVDTLGEYNPSIQELRRMIDLG